MSTVYSRPQLSPSELRCSPHTTYYTNFFVLRMAVIINGQQAEIGFSENKEITLNCHYPTTECMSINFDTISSRVEAVLKKHGVSHVSNFWVGEVPFFQVGFSCEYSLKSFLCSQREMQGEVGTSISAKLREGQPLAASPNPVSQGFPVEVETELFLVLPEAEDNIRAVSMENCNSCLALWKESEKFDFGAIFRTFRLKEGRATVNRYGKLSVNVLVSELSDVVDWFHLGLYLGVPHPVLLRIERERPFSVIERLSHMLDWWVKNEEKSTWSAVVKALVGIKMRRLAKKMAVKYNVAMPTDAERRALEALPFQTEASHSTSSLVASLEKLRSDNGKKDEQLEKVLETLKLEFQEKAKTKRKLSRSKRELMTARKKMTSLSRKRKEAERMLQLKEKELFFLQQVAIKGSRDLSDVIESKKAEIAQLREQLGGVNSELSRAREETQQMREKLQQTTIELEKQSMNVRELERTRADLERERSRVDMMLKQLCDRNQSERVAPTELDTLKKAVAEKEREVERLSSQLETKETEKQKLLEQAAKQSQHEEELEDQLVQLTADISDLTASLVEAKDGSAKAEVEVEDLKSRQRVIAELKFGETPAFKNPSSREVATLKDSNVVDVCSNPLAEMRYDGAHHPVPVNKFISHVSRMHSNDDFLFSEEYRSVEPEHKPTIEASWRSCNTSKNRYTHITAYDQYRVRLQEIPGIPGSDYINACHMDGYRQPNGFIATQGPVPESVPDFWRMIWEQGTATIVMLANLEERGRIKCHLYWPEQKVVLYDLVRVQLLEVLVLAEYTVRTFSVQKEGSKEERTVTQYHFTVWPNHGVPEHPTPLLHFVRKVAASNPRNSGPMVVHCSAGAGRTGTFITLHAQLRRIKAENNIDVFGFVRSMRYHRCFMVQTEPQYIFIHDALLEAIECGETEVPARELREQYRKLGLKDSSGDTQILIEFEKLETTVHQNPPIAIGTLPFNKSKNRYTVTELLPYDKSRCCLSAIPGVAGSDYINASYINAYHKQRGFIATQGPLPNTTDDFWRMVWEHSSATIVMLTREREGGKIQCHKYWPEVSAEIYGTVQVIPHEANEYPNYTLREFNVVDTRGENQSSLRVKQFQYTGWPEDGMPESGAGFIDLIDQVQRWQRNSGDRPIIVHCSGGCGRTGTFIAINLLIKRLKTEGVVDVFHTVRGLRLQRPKMVSSVEQYEFCYKTVLEYLDSFEIFGNFK